MPAPFPHHYRIRASYEASESAPVGSLEGEGLPDLKTGAPPEFDGTPGVWSPEHLLAASAASCLCATFAAIARLSKLEWRSFRCEAEIVLDKTDKGLRVTEVILRPHAMLANERDLERGGRILEKSKAACIVTNAIAANVRREPKVEAA